MGWVTVTPNDQTQEAVDYARVLEALINAELEDRFVKLMLYGTTHPEAWQDFQALHRESERA